VTTSSAGPIVVGLVSDTHGRIRPDVLAALAGSDLILHAGDVGGRHVLAALAAIAPVRAVRGNTDDVHDPDLGDSVRLDVGGLRIHVSHGHELGSPTPDRLAAKYDADVIVFGHTHRAVVARLGTSLIVNPGSAGSPRFGAGLSVGRLVVEAGDARAEIIVLAD
jgi:putative phosphoesterase